MDSSEPSLKTSSFLEAETSMEGYDGDLSPKNGYQSAEGPENQPTQSLNKNKSKGSAKKV